MSQHHPSTVVPDTFLHGDSALARLARPVSRFLAVEASGGILLVAATVVALVWANSPWSGGYEQLWSTPIDVTVGSFRFEEDLLHLVNDGFMALFFFVVGLEIKRELTTGELRDRRNVRPAGHRGPRRHGRPGRHLRRVQRGAARAAAVGAIPMATDIAFALGVVALLGARVPEPAEGVPAHAGDRRRHRRHRGDRRLLQRRDRARSTGGRRRHRRRRRRHAFVAGDLRTALRARRPRPLARRLRVRCARHDRRRRHGSAHPRPAAAIRARGRVAWST